MSSNRLAITRYLALDRCFSNRFKKYYMKDLVEECRKAIEELTGNPKGVQRRQIYNDIIFMKSEAGYQIELDKIKDGGRVYYRYEDPEFSIRNKGINSAEAEQLKDTLSVLSRFKGLPQFDWVDEIKVRLEDTFKLRVNQNPVVGFESNPYLTGMEHFEKLFNSIQNQQVLSIEYKSYRRENSIEMIISPWYLKQFNNRWFLFGYHEELKRISTLAIDRIMSIDTIKYEYTINEESDFESYFDDVIGVTVFDNAEIEKIVLHIDKKRWPYIRSKPLHHSQTINNNVDLEDYVEISLKVKINNELKALLFSHMDAIKIIEPLSLREEFKSVAENIVRNNS